MKSRVQTTGGSGVQEEILSRLIALPTLTQNVVANNEALQYIETMLREAGLYVRRFALESHGALVATTRPNQKAPVVMLAGHVDVVPGSARVFTLKQQDGKLLGRGTFDMKFAIAAYLQLVRSLGRDVANYDFGIMITTDEEDGTGINGTKELVARGYRPRTVVLPDGGDDWRLETLAKGIWRFDITANGKAAHGSRPWEGDSAAFRLIDTLHALRTYFKDHGPLTNTLNIGTMAGGKARNQIPDHMVAEAEVRIINEAQFAVDRAFIERACQRFGTKLTTRQAKLPIKNDVSNPYLATFAKSIKRVTGSASGSCISHGATDAQYFADLGIPCVITRPPGGGHHSENEWVDRASFHQLPHILADYLNQVAKPTLTVPA